MTVDPNGQSSPRDTSAPGDAPSPTEVTVQISATKAVAHRAQYEVNTSPTTGYPHEERFAAASSPHGFVEAVRGPAGWADPQSAIPPATGAMFSVNTRSPVKIPSQRGWRRLIHRVARINVGLSPDEIYEMELHDRIRRNVRGAYQIGVFGLKGGIGKTAVTVALGSVLSRVRGDRILAVDADPDGGNLADRTGRQSTATVADLLSDKNLVRYNDIRAYTSMNRANLEVLPSEEYSGARREFNDEDWKSTVGIVSRYYNLVLADCGAGLFQPASRGVLSTVSGVVIVASASIDGARQAAVTMDWLRQNGYQDLLRRSCVVINHVVPGTPNIDVEDLVRQFERHIPSGRVVVLPWDQHVAAGMDIDLDLLGRHFRRRVTELAAALSDDFDRLEHR